MRAANSKSNTAPDSAQIASQDVVSLSPSELFSLLGTSPSGLTGEDAASRLDEFGPNDVARKRARSAPVEFLLHFKNPITLILVAAAVVSGIVGERLDAALILAIVLVSVTMDFVQEYRAGKAAEALRKRVGAAASVMRDGSKQEVDATQIVPGDIVLLSAGDIVPADARTLSARDFFVDQSALTGESFPVEKTSQSISPSPDSTKWDNYLFAGTSVTNGTATALVVRTGGSTQFGEIARRSAESKPETDFEAGLRKFGYLIMQVTVLLVVTVFLINAAFRRPALESLLFSVALAVGLTPGLLPVILSVNLARGATAMSRKGVIVKRLAAIQNFGSMDVLCSDKTGTLTENRVAMIRHVDFDGNESDKVLLFSVLNSHFQTGLRSPLDEAILKHESDVKVDEYTKIDEIPFDFTRKRLSIVARHGSSTILITKGAPEEVAKVLSRCEHDGKVEDITPEDRRKIDRLYKNLSSQGFRVLGVCYSEIEAKQAYSIADEHGMVFLGFIAFTDPIKETVNESLALLRQSGVRLMILTGDNEIVAGKVCDQLGFQVYQYRRGRAFDERVGTVTRTVQVESVSIMQSSEIEDISDDALARVVERADIFTRVSPSQKNRILNALRANGHVVGYLGDGINDTPSMKVADVSISVMNAVDIAKESADIILLKNDLKVIAEGVIEGRKTFGNTMKYIQMAVSSNFGNMFSAAGASLFLTFLPMLPIQILLNNLLYSFAQIALPLDEVDQTYVQRPQRLRASFVRNFMLFFGPISSIFDFLTFFIMLVVFRTQLESVGPSLFQTAWFVESLFTQSLVIFVIRTRTVPFFKSRPSNLLLLNVIVVLGVALALPFTPVAGKVFGFVPLPASFMLILVGFIVVYLGLVELMKLWFYKTFGRVRQSTR